MIELSEKDQATLQKKIKTFKGQFDVLESALGALVVGQFYGWRVLRMCHSSRSWNKYEKVLGLKFQKVCPEYTDISERNLGIKIANKLGAFWKVAQGKVDIDRRVLK